MNGKTMKARRTLSLLLLFVFIGAQCGFSHAQNAKTVTIRMIDAKTGILIPTSEFLVRVDHKEDVHGNWVQQNDDGTGKLTLPPGASIFSILAKYNESSDIYVDCDAARDKPEPIPHWYAISDILALGVVAPNGCSKHTAVAKPGEFVFFVRKQNWQEKVRDYSQ